ncbi:MAG: hypothetical protein AAF985_23845 [Bacteroidota bacterium]
MKRLNLTTPLSSSKVDSSNDSPYLNLAVWEVAYQNELKAFWNIITRKAKRIQYLESLDPFSLAETKAKRQLRALQGLQTELNVLVGFKKHVEHLKFAYFNTSLWLTEYYQQKEQNHLKQILELKKSYHSLHKQFELASAWELRFLNAITQIQKEAQ